MFRTPNASQIRELTVLALARSFLVLNCAVVRGRFLGNSSLKSLRRKRMNRTGLDTEDYISSKLPEPILPKILSLLDIKEAFRASIVSRTWNDACKALPELTFDRKFFLSNNLPLDRVYGRHAKAKLDLVDAILSRQIIHNRARVEKICLYIPYIREYLDFDVGTYLERFIKLLIQANISELVIKDKSYCLDNTPQSLYYAKSLTKLNLSWFTLQMPNCGGDFKLSNLKELKLIKCKVGNELIELFLSSCRDLVNLQLSYCSFDALHIGHYLVKLKKFCLKSKDVKKNEIKAPNIQILEVFHVKCLNLLDVVGCKNLTVLDLHHFAFSDSTLNVVDISLPMLETAILVDGCDVKKLRISSNRLKILKLTKLDSLEELDVDSPNLISFTWVGIDLFRILISGALRLQELFFDTYQSPSREVETNLNDVLDLLSKFSYAKSVTLELDDKLAAKMIIPKNLRKIYPPPLQKAKKLFLVIRTEDAKTCYFDVLLGLLWIAPCLDTLTVAHDRLGFAELELTYNHDQDSVQSEGPDPLCSGCSLLPFKCWRHTLCKVEICNFGRFGILQELIDYFSEHFKSHLRRSSITCVMGLTTIVADAQIYWYL